MPRLIRKRCGDRACPRHPDPSQPTRRSAVFPCPRRGYRGAMSHGLSRRRLLQGAAAGLAAGVIPGSSSALGGGPLRAKNAVAIASGNGVAVAENQIITMAVADSDIEN